MQSGYRYQRTEPPGKNFDPDFRPELSPQRLLEMGIFGGKYMTDCRPEFPAEWFENAKLSPEKRNDDLNFFGLEIELWRIGDSSIAPKFNVAVRPNEWTKGRSAGGSSRVLTRPKPTVAIAASISLCVGGVSRVPARPKPARSRQKTATPESVRIYPRPGPDRHRADARLRVSRARDRRRRPGARGRLRADLGEPRRIAADQDRRPWRYDRGRRLPLADPEPLRPACLGGALCDREVGRWLRHFQHLSVGVQP